MGHRIREYSLAELLEHPVLGLAMEHDGLDRRSVDLVREEAGQEWRSPQTVTRAWHDDPRAS